MHTPTAILSLILAACGGLSAGAADPEPPPEQPDRKPPDDIVKDYIFCCQSVDPKTQSGEGCITIGEKQIDQCANVLYCEGNWTKVDGKVTCSE